MSKKNCTSRSKQSIGKIRNSSERNQIIMNKKKIIKGYKTLISSSFNADNPTDKFKDGIIWV